MRNTTPQNAEEIANAKNVEINLDDIKLDPNNVRFLHISKGHTDKQVEDVLWKESDTQDLYKQILSAGGLYQEPVLNSKLIVIEGNRRVVCLRRLKQEARKGDLPGISKNQFDKIHCKVLPENTPLQTIDIFLATIHVKGKKPWNAFNKAKHIFNLHELRGLTYDDLAKKLGMGKVTVIRAVEVYAATEDYGKRYKDDSEWFRKFTYFDELYKRKDLVDFRKDPKNLNKFQNWVYHEKLDDVREVRKLALLLHDNEATQEFEKKGFDAAMNLIGMKDPSINSSEFKKIKEVIQVIRNLPRKELSKIINDSSRFNLLSSLKKEIDSLLKDIKSMRKT
ncbi:MAG: hypothetical protein Q8L34_06595 [Candidatus Woesearchaeota archaeon]|nr:hypothetical protein [Candidatus Woesearchaeota archaeon]